MIKTAALIMLLVTTMAVQAKSGSITVTVVQSSQANATKTFTFVDTDIDRIIAANQSGANTSVNGTATRAQVLLFIMNQWIATLGGGVGNYETQKAKDAIVAPAPINPQ